MVVGARATLERPVETVVILVAAAVLSAAGAWWWLSRPAERRGWDRGEPRLVGFGGSDDDAGRDAFVFAPTADTSLREDRPPPAVSVARLALIIAIWTVLLVAVAWAAGLLLKLQLDRYFLSGH